MSRFRILFVIALLMYIHASDISADVPPYRAHHEQTTALTPTSAITPHPRPYISVEDVSPDSGYQVGSDSDVVVAASWIAAGDELHGSHGVLRYTTDGSTPTGAEGEHVVDLTRGEWERHGVCDAESASPGLDSYGRIPAQPAGTVVKYILEVSWDSFDLVYGLRSHRRFVNSNGCDGSTCTTASCATVFSYEVRQAVAPVASPRRAHHEQTTAATSSGRPYMSVADASSDSGYQVASGAEVIVATSWHPDDTHSPGGSLRYTTDGSTPVGAAGEHLVALEVDHVEEESSACGLATIGSRPMTSRGQIPAQAPGTVVKYILEVSWTSGGGPGGILGPQTTTQRRFVNTNGCDGSSCTTASCATVFSYEVRQATETAIQFGNETSVYGQTMKLDAHVMGGSPTGDVQFLRNGNIIRTVALGQTSTADGASAMLEISTEPVGTYSYSARYVGNSMSLPSTSPAFSRTIGKATTQLTSLTASTRGGEVYGDPIEYVVEAGVAEAGAVLPPYGAVRLFRNGVGWHYLTMTNGTGRITVNDTPAGSPVITARYLGNSRFTPASDETKSVSPTVAKAPTSTILQPHTNTSTAYGDAVTLTATASAAGQGVREGRIGFYKGTTLVGSAAVVNGVATLTTVKLPAGTYDVYAKFHVTGNYEASASLNSVSQTVTKAFAAVALSTDPSPSTHSANPFLIATVTPADGPKPTDPKGKVCFFRASTSLTRLGCASTTPTEKGQVATLTPASYTALPLGTHSIKAYYYGSLNFNPAWADPVQHTVQAPQ